jgi:hypothetical protein
MLFNTPPVKFDVIAFVKSTACFQDVAVDLARVLLALGRIYASPDVLGLPIAQRFCRPEEFA